MPSEDAVLIAAAAAGDQDAFGGLVARYQDRLYGSLLRMTGSAEDAQDLTQEAFVQAYLKLDTFAGRSAFYTWLYRIAFNRCVSRSRKRRERASLDALRESADVEPVDPSPSPDAPLLAAERATLVHEALARLADEQRQVMVLREIDGLDYQQIAEVIGVPVGTVRSRLFRARLQLKELLAAVLGDPPTVEPQSAKAADPAEPTAADGGQTK
ncbi:MAG: sigma-70 family RNA polymerase sigma factor [Planctomycetota bacterium]